MASAWIWPSAVYPSNSSAWRHTSETRIIIEIERLGPFPIWPSCSIWTISYSADHYVWTAIAGRWYNILWEYSIILQMIGWNWKQTLQRAPLCSTSKCSIELWPIISREPLPPVVQSSYVVLWERRSKTSDSKDGQPVFSGCSIPRKHWCGKSHHARTNEFRASFDKIYFLLNDHRKVEAEWLFQHVIPLNANQ